MIQKTNTQFENIVSANCDCCGEPIKVQFGRIDDHMSIGGYKDGKILEAIVCIKCMEEKFSDVKIQQKTNTLGYC